jgi:hypothetical protein
MYLIIGALGGCLPSYLGAGISYIIIKRLCRPFFRLWGLGTSRATKMQAMKAVHLVASKLSR